MEKLLSFGKGCRGKLAASVILAIIGVGAGIVPYFAVSQIIAGLFAQTVTVGWLVMPVLAALAGYTVYVVLNSVSTALSHEAAFAILENIRISISAKLQRVPMGTILDTPSGKYKNLIVDTVEKLEKLIAHMVPEITSNLVLPIAVIIYLFVIDWRMALLSLVTIPVGLLAYLGMMKDYTARYGKYEQANNHMNATIVEYVNGIEVIKAFNQSAESYGKFTSSVEDFRDSTLSWWRGSWVYMAVALSIMPSTLLVTLPAGAWFYSQGTLGLADFVTCVILSMGIVGPLIKVMNFTDNFAMIDSTMKDVGAVMDLPELKRPEQETAIQGEVFEFKHVSFAYHDAEVLSDISFKTQPGQVTAIVGPSGSGKSTIARLMAGFWDADGGTISFGGQSVQNIPQIQFSQYISYVTQDNYLFNIPIMENIRMGKPGASDEAVVAAAKFANCHEFIEKLDQGYQTLAGDAGGSLSGGERQRVAIARAILKDAPVIILDEATAYSDPENEHQIQESLLRLARNKTMVVIAHRLSTIVHAQQILVVKSGRIEASGTHQELLQKSDTYRQLWSNYAETKEMEG